MSNLYKGDITERRVNLICWADFLFSDSLLFNDDVQIELFTVFKILIVAEIVCNVIFNYIIFFLYYNNLS